MPLPILESRDLFPTPANALPLVTFAAHGNDYQGIQNTAYEADELAWDNDDKGRWRGPAPLHIAPVDLSLTGAAYEHSIHEFADVARIDSGAAINLFWALPDADAAMEDTPYRDVPDGGKVNGDVTWRVILQDCSDGTLIYNATQIGDVNTAITAQSDGSYTAWVRAESMTAKESLPDDYFDVTGYTAIPDKFRYEVAGITHTWDWLHDVGLRPVDGAQIAIDGVTDMYAQYDLLVDSGGLETQGDWTTYIANATTQSGEWSALQIVVGDGDFTVGAGVLPAPGSALVKGDGAGGSNDVCFEILARSISAAKVLSDGTCRISGAWASRSGAALGYWTLNADGSGTQLGCGFADQFNLCEMALLNHFATDIWVDTDGEEWILTKANLRRYDSTKTDIHDRLPGVPKSTAGHPGGRCLRRDGVLKFFTENFTQGQGNFYNRLQIQGDARSIGIGTVFHGDNCAELYLGDYYGWRQDKQFDQTDATQYLSRMVYDAWNYDGMPSFPASAYRWQRLGRVGPKMLAAGKSATSEAAIWGVVADGQFKEASNAYRIRRLQDVGDETYAVAFTLSGDVKTWKAVAFTGDFVKACFTYDDGTTKMAANETDLTDAGIDVSKLPAYLLWKPIETASAGGVWLQTNDEPASGTYLTKASAAGLVTYSGTLPYDGDVWCKICFTVYDDGGTGNDAIEPEPCCTDAACAAALFTSAQHICMSLPANVAPFYAMQVSDTNDFVTRLSRKLDSINATIPNLWARVDSDAAASDLSSYTIRVPWNRNFILPVESNQQIDVCVLMETGYGTVKAPVVQRR